MPAEAGIQHRRRVCGDPNILDSRFRGNDMKYVTVIANPST
jgi:hypothetical protein